MAGQKFLTDEQWVVLSPLIPPSKRRADGRSSPIEHDDRAVLDGVLWKLRTDGAWADFPDRHSSYSTCF
jgi:transposase